MPIVCQCWLVKEEGLCYRTDSRLGPQLSGQCVLKEGDVPDNAPQCCTQCGNVGHNRTTCNEVYQLPIVYPVE